MPAGETNVDKVIIYDQKFVHKSFILIFTRCSVLLTSCVGQCNRHGLDLGPSHTLWKCSDFNRSELLQRTNRDRVQTEYVETGGDSLMQQDE